MAAAKEAAHSSTETYPSTRTVRAEQPAAETSPMLTNAPNFQNDSHSELGCERYQSSTREYCASSQTTAGRSDIQASA